jgi:hypothetical protein
MRMEAKVYQVRRRSKTLSPYQQLLMRHLTREMRENRAEEAAPALMSLS